MAPVGLVVAAAAAPILDAFAGWVSGLVLVGSVMLTAVVYVRLVLPRFEILRTLVRSMDEGFCVIEIIYDGGGKPIDYRFIEVNPAFETQTGLVDALGKTIRQMVPDHDSHWFEIYDKVARTGEDIRFENLAKAMGRYYDVFAFRIGKDGSRKVGLIFNDISVRKLAEQELLLIARYDRLTGLPNRAMFQDYFDRALSRAERDGRPVALLFLDLDGFKTINDTLGHPAGDELLRLVAERLSACMRMGDLVSRFGGDEFTIVLENCPPHHLAPLAEKVIQALETPFDLDGGPARISASLGIVSYPESATDGQLLIERADAAMYAAKKAGKGRYRFWKAPEVESG